MQTSGLYISLPGLVGNCCESVPLAFTPQTGSFALHGQMERDHRRSPSAALFGPLHSRTRWAISPTLTTARFSQESLFFYHIDESFGCKGFRDV